MIEDTTQLLEKRERGFLFYGGKKGRCPYLAYLVRHKCRTAIPCSYVYSTKSLQA